MQERTITGGYCSRRGQLYCALDFITAPFHAKKKHVGIGKQETKGKSWGSFQIKRENRVTSAELGSSYYKVSNRHFTAMMISNKNTAPKVKFVICALHKYCPNANASLFSYVSTIPTHSPTPFRPCSPYFSFPLSSPFCWPSFSSLFPPFPPTPPPPFLPSPLPPLPFLTSRLPFKHTHSISPTDPTSLPAPLPLPPHRIRLPREELSQTALLLHTAYQAAVAALKNDHPFNRNPPTVPVRNTT